VLCSSKGRYARDHDANHLYFFSVDDVVEILSQAHFRILAIRTVQFVRFPDRLENLLGNRVPPVILNILLAFADIAGRLVYPTGGEVMVCAAEKHESN